MAVPGEPGEPVPLVAWLKGVCSTASTMHGVRAPNPVAHAAHNAADRAAALSLVLGLTALDGRLSDGA